MNKRFMISEISNILLTITLPIALIMMIRDLADYSGIELIIALIGFSLTMIMVCFVFYISINIHLIAVKKIRGGKNESNIN